LLWGPTAKNETLRFLNFWPVYTNVISVALNTDEPGDALQDRSARGMAAVEYVLFGPELSLPSLSSVQRERVCSYLLDMTTEIVHRTQHLHSVWQTEYTRYAAESIEKDKRLSLLLATQLNTVEEILWQRVGLPAGFFRGPADISKLDSIQADLSSAGLHATFKSINRLVEGDGRGTGLAGLLIKKHPRLSRSLLAVSRECVRLAAMLPESMTMALSTDLDSLESLFDTTGELKALLLETADTLNLSVQFEEDGD
jgi:predicted lipoprotein